MDFNGERLRLDCKQEDDFRVMSDLVITFGRTMGGGWLESNSVDDGLGGLQRRINQATPARFKTRKPRPVLELDLDEIWVCAGLIDPAIRTRVDAPVPVESMNRTRDMLYALLGQDVE